jgi:hypothetical protein
VAESETISSIKKFLQFQPLPPKSLLYIIAIVFVYIITAEMVKQFIYRRVLKDNVNE